VNPVVNSLPFGIGGTLNREGEMNDKMKAILGGAGMMVGAVVWFVVGWMAGRIFFYPPILFVIGIVALIKGLMMPAEPAK
jgi:hypothetical protein